MKMLFMSIAMLLTGEFAGANANPLSGISTKAKESFSREYPEAESIRWETVKGYQMARFGFHNHSMVAFYNMDCTCAGSARSLLYEDLPLAVSRLIDRRFANGDLQFAYEINNKEGSFYWFTVGTASTIFQVKASPYGEILTIQKQKPPANAEKPIH